MNKSLLIGNLGKAPIVTFMPNGTKVVKFSIATQEKWKDRETGEIREKVDWHDVVSFKNPLNDSIEKYLDKGSKVYVEGKLETRHWTDKQGITRKTTEIILQKIEFMNTKNNELAEPEPEPEIDDDLPQI